MNCCTIQSGCDVLIPIDATSSPDGSGHGGPARASERNTPLAKPRARSDTTPTVSPTAACGDTPVTSWNAPSRNPARTSGSSLSIGRDDTRARRKSSVRRMRTVP